MNIPPCSSDKGDAREEARGDLNSDVTTDKITSHILVMSMGLDFYVPNDKCWCSSRGHCFFALKNGKKSYLTSFYIYIYF